MYNKSRVRDQTQRAAHYTDAPRRLPDFAGRPDITDATDSCGRSALTSPALRHRSCVVRIDARIAPQCRFLTFADSHRRSRDATSFRDDSDVIPVGFREDFAAPSAEDVASVLQRDQPVTRRATTSNEAATTRVSIMNSRQNNRQWDRLVGIALSMLAAGLAAGAATAGSLNGNTNKSAITADDSVNCSTTISAGSGSSRFTTCFSNDGNVLQFTVPDGNEHIRAGALAEGYLLCRGNGRVDVDLAEFEIGFLPSTITQPNGPNTLPLTSTRRTNDNSLRLRQKFTVQSPNTVLVEMTVTNTSSAAIPDVQIARFVDADVDVALTRFVNDFSIQRRTVVAENNLTPDGGSLLLSAPFSSNARPSIGVFSRYPSDCSDEITTSPVLGIDGFSKVVVPVGTLAAGASATVRFVYTGN